MVEIFQTRKSENSGAGSIIARVVRLDGILGRLFAEEIETLVGFVSGGIQGQKSPVRLLQVVLIAYQENSGQDNPIRRECHEIESFEGVIYSGEYNGMYGKVEEYGQEKSKISGSSLHDLFFLDDDIHDDLTSNPECEGKGRGTGKFNRKAGGIRAKIRSRTPFKY